MAYINGRRNQLGQKMDHTLSNKNVSIPRKGKRRKNELNLNIPAKKMHLVTPVVPKNAICILHEMYRGLNFKIINQEGPIHSPTFTASVEINGIQYEGRGKTKKNAKHSAAEAALRSLVQFKNPSVEGPNIHKTNEDTDFTSDVLCREADFGSAVATANKIIVRNGETIGNGLIKKSTESTKPVQADKNPIMLLNELHPQAKYEIVSENGEQSSRYTVAVTINGQRFEETGSSKKLSKAAAARSALLSFHNVVLPTHPTPELGKPFLINSRDEAGVPQVFSDHISRIIKDKYQSVMSGNQQHIRYKVLAGIVMSEGYDKNTCQVISIATGTKCINGERMSVNGVVLNDSHAEIIARRCLCNFFYMELEKHKNNMGAQSIFESFQNGFRLKSKYKFHLYVSSAPCGDSRIFSPFDEYHVDRHPNRKARGQLRTKIECGEGTIPVKTSDVIQTWDGVLQGERLLTMSCSDKIAKWNAVGLQGALLSNFVEPVYLESIILGSLFHPQHLYRAVYGRIEHSVEGLPPPYRLNEPKLAAILNTEARQVGKAPNYSVNWTIGDTSPEIVNAVHGRTEDNQISRVSKCHLFYKFLGLVGKIPSFNNLSAPERALPYSNWKKAARDFQITKAQLFAAFSKAKLGEWVKKPLEVDQFDWDEESLRQVLTLDSPVKSESQLVKTEATQ